MERKLFVDTWGWLTLRDKKEEKHKAVSEYYRLFHSQGGWIYTTDYVLDETFTLFFRRLPFSKAKESMLLLLDSFQKEVLFVEFITLERFQKAKDLRLKFQDKPLISFTDLSSMVVMEEFSIAKILTNDVHFGHVGMGFQLVP